MTTDVLLSLGSNLGDRRAFIDMAVERLAKLPGTRLRARSSYYKTEPVGPVKQEWFLNIAVALGTDLSRSELATACRAIEADLGRDRSKEIPSGPRPIDVDVVLYGDSGELDERAFVLVPLAEIAPDKPVGGRSLGERAEGIGSAGIVRLDWPVPSL